MHFCHKFLIKNAPFSYEKQCFQVDFSCLEAPKHWHKRCFINKRRRDEEMSKNNKIFSDRVKRSPFETEEEFQDSKRPNAKPSEPSRTTQNQASNNRDVKKGGATDTKKV
jgi:hypothetical protein